MQPSTQQQSQVEHHLDDETAKDLIGLIADKKVEVQKGALNIVLQFTNNKDNQLKFLKLNIVPLLLKYMFKEDLMTICLTNLINFSSYLADEENMPEEITQQFVKTAEPILLQLKSWTGLERDLALLYLTNISKLKDVSYDVIVGEGDKQAYFIELLLGLLENGPQNKLYHVVNILANVSSFKQGRQFLTSDEGRMVCRLEKMLFSSQREMRLGILKILRNCLFEFQNEKFIDGLLEEQKKFIDMFGAYLTKLLINGKHLVAEAQRQQLSQKFKGYDLVASDFSLQTTNLNTELNQVELAIECLLIMNNVDFNTKAPKYDKDQFRQLVKELQRLPLNSQVKDKLEFVNVFFC